MNIYLAASYSQRLTVEDRARELRALRQVIVSTWSDGHHEARPDIDHNGTQWERAGWAAEDLADLARADLVVYCADLGSSQRGGAHVECGYALGLGKALAVVGDCGGNVFYCLPYVAKFTDWAAFLGNQRQRRPTTSATARR